MKFFLCASGCLRKGPRAGIYAGSWLQQFRPDSRHGAFSAGGSWPGKPEVRRDRGDGTLSRGPVISVTDITRSNTVRKGSSAQAVSEDQLFYALCGVTVAGAHEETPESGDLLRVKKRGEQAGTLLLIPILMLFALTLLLVVAPDLMQMQMT